MVERWNLAGEALKEAMDDATRLALADQEAAGIDIVCDGEQRRSTHYTHFIHQLGGVDCEKLKAKSMRGGKFTQEVPRITGSDHARQPPGGRRLPVPAPPHEPRRSR